MNKQTIKILISIVCVIGIIILSYTLWIISVFVSGKVWFHTFTISTAGIALIGLLTAWVTANKKIFYIFSRLLMAIISVVGITSLYSFYDKTIPTVKEPKLLLHEYLPFVDNSKIAVLPVQSSLQLTDTLPKIDGATALYPLYSAFVHAVYPKKIYDPYDSSEVRCSTTAHAYENLLNGSVDVIFCAAPSQEQQQKAQDLGIHFNMTPIGKEAFVFFVNKNNPVDTISLEEIKGIYSGRITNWKELGGKNRSIMVFQRPKNSGSQTTLEKIMANTPLIEPRMNEIIDGMGGIIEQTADYKNYGNAIGYSFLFYSTQMVQNGFIKLLAINGIPPTHTTIKNNTYPFASYFYAITRDDVSENTQKLINWILSKEGQLPVEKTGYVPLAEGT